MVPPLRARLLKHSKICPCILPSSQILVHGAALLQGPFKLSNLLCEPLSAAYDKMSVAAVRNGKDLEQFRPWRCVGINSAGCTKRHSPALVQAAQAEWAARRLERECCSHRHTRLDVQGEQEIYP